MINRSSPLPSSLLHQLGHCVFETHSSHGNVPCLAQSLAFLILIRGFFAKHIDNCPSVSSSLRLESTAPRALRNTASLDQISSDSSHFLSHLQLSYTLTRQSANYALPCAPLLPLEQSL